MTEYAATCLATLGIFFVVVDCTHRPDPDKAHERAQLRPKCRWESRYDNTLQHDIHRELVCDR